MHVFSISMGTVVLSYDKIKNCTHILSENIVNTIYYHFILS